LLNKKLKLLRTTFMNFSHRNHCKWFTQAIYIATELCCMLAALQSTSCPRMAAIIGIRNVTVIHEQPGGVGYPSIH